MVGGIPSFGPRASRSGAGFALAPRRKRLALSCPFRLSPSALLSWSRSTCAPFLRRFAPLLAAGRAAARASEREEDAHRQART